MDHRAVIVLSALLLNAALGGPRRWYAALGIGRLSLLPARGLRHFERKLNRDRLGAREREGRGGALVGAAALAGLIAGALGSWLFQHNLGFLELAVVAVMLPVRPVWDRIAAIRNALAAGDIPAAREALSGTAWRHHAVLDEFGLARAAIETTAVDFSEKIAGPVLAYAWLGLPGLFVFKSLTLARDVLSNVPDFGNAARLVHPLLHTIPSRLMAALWLAASLFMPAGNIGAAVKRAAPGFLADGPRALCVRVAAAVLRVSLGGPGSPYAPNGWMENGPAKALPADLRRAMAAYAFASLFLFLLVGALL